MLAAVSSLAFCSAVAQAPTFDRAMAFGNLNTPGGSDVDQTVVDAQGNTYIVGTFGSTLRLGTATLYSNGGSDAFVAKLDAAGNVVWAVNGGGSTTDYGRGIGVDAAGNVYVTGIFAGPTATFGSTTLRASNGGLFDIYVAKLSPSGTWLWAVQGGGGSGGEEYAQSLAVDGAGNAYITGTYSSASATFGSTVLTNTGPTGSAEIFVAKLNAAGSWQWAVSGGGSGADFAESIVLDGSGNACITGSTNSLNAVFGSVGLARTSLNSGLLVARLSAAGSWQWATGSGGTGRANGYDLTVDAAGNSFVAGQFSGAATFGSARLTSIGPTNTDLVVARLDNAGAFVWATAGGGSGTEIGHGVALDGTGSVYAGASFNSATLTLGSSSLTSAGSFDALVGRLSAATGTWQGAVAAGGTGPDQVQHLASGPGSTLYLTGNFADAPADFGSLRLLNNAGSLPTGFLARLIASPLSSKSASPKSAFTLWPNPATGTVRLLGPEPGQQVEVFTALGQHLSTHTQPRQGPLPLVLPAGLYLVRSAGTSQRLLVE